MTVRVLPSGATEVAGARSLREVKLEVMSSSAKSKLNGGSFLDLKYLVYCM